MPFTDHVTQETIRELVIRTRGSLPTRKAGAIVVSVLRVTEIK